MDGEESSVEFIDVENSDTVVNRKYAKSIYSPLIIWMVKKGYVKSEQIAYWSIVTLITLLFVLSMVFIYVGLTYESYNSAEGVLRPGNGFTR